MRAVVAVAVVVLRLDAPLRLSWSPGPLPLKIPGGGTTDSGERATFYSPLAAEVLYSQRQHAFRYRRLAPDLVLDAVEYLPPSEAVPGAVLCHLSSDASPDGFVEALHKIVGRNGVPDLARAVGGAVAEAVAPHRGFVVTMLTFDGAPNGPDGPWVDPDVPPEDRWNWVAATATPAVKAPLGARTFARESANLIELSADWTALVLRDGASFVGRRADTGESDDYFRSAEVYVRSIYTDALVIGWWQREGLLALADRLASVENLLAEAERLEELQDELSRFRHRFWWHHVTRHQSARDLIQAARAQHDLEALMHQLDAELTTYREQSSRRSLQRTNALITAFALVGLPVTAIAALRDATDWTGAIVALALLAVFVTAAALVFVSPVGRRMVSTLRSGRSGGDGDSTT